MNFPPVTPPPPHPDKRMHAHSAINSNLFRFTRVRIVCATNLLFIGNLFHRHRRRQVKQRNAAPVSPGIRTYEQAHTHHSTPSLRPFVRLAAGLRAQRRHRAYIIYVWQLDEIKSSICTFPRAIANTSAPPPPPPTPTPRRWQNCWFNRLRGRPHSRARTPMCLHF